MNISRNILYVGCDDVDCYDSIQSAINDAISGDTIYVFDDSSPYFENIIVDKSLNIIGENKETTIINGRNNGNVVYISADGVNISNFTIQSGGNNAGIVINSDENFIINNYFFNHYYGIKISSAHYNKIENNNIENCEFAHYVFDSTDNEIYENILKHNTIGLKLLQNSNENNIYRNVISFSQEAVSIDHSSYNNIYWNLLTDSDYGIHSIESSYNKIYNKNQIIDNIYAIYLDRSDYFSIYDNTISNNEKYGIYLIDSMRANIHENIIDNNEYGLFLDSSSGNNIYWNDVKQNINGIYYSYSPNNDFYLNNVEDNFQFGIYIFYSSRLKLSYNNFISNYVSAYFKQSFFSFNSWKKNYWDDWSGNGAHRIYGEIDDFILIEDWFMFDRRPVENPYLI
jgi:nitrous oxidase accessory protein